MAIRQRPDGRWVVYYRAKDGSGKIKEEYFGRGEQAEAEARKRNADLNIRPYTPGHKKPKSPPFYLLAKKYVQDRNWGAYSRKHLLIRLEANILPHFGDRPAGGLTHDDMARYVKKRSKQGVKMSTIRREITDVKAILNWAVHHQPPLLPSNPVRDFQAPREDDEIILPPTREELQRIMQTAPDHLQRAIMLSFYTGLRPGAVELLSLKWNQVNWEAHTIHVISAKKGGPRRREVPIHKQIIPTLAAWYAADKQLFEAQWKKECEADPEKKKKKKNVMAAAPIIHYGKKPIKSIQTTWENTLDRAGITRRLRPYDLRHRFITTALERGADIKTLSEIVGSDPKTLIKHYQHVSNKMRRKMINEMDGLYD